jgi:hypothetical protein
MNDLLNAATMINLNTATTHPYDLVAVICTAFFAAGVHINRLNATCITTLLTTTNSYPYIWIVLVSTAIYIGHHTIKSNSLLTLTKPRRKIPPPSMNTAMAISTSTSGPMTPKHQIVTDAPGGLGHFVPGGEPCDFHEDVLAQGGVDAERERVKEMEMSGPLLGQQRDGKMRLQDVDMRRRRGKRDERCLKGNFGPWLEVDGMIVDGVKCG